MRPFQRHRRMRKDMVQKYLDRRRSTMPSTFTPGSHWHRRWVWCSKFVYFMNVKEIKPCAD